MKCCPRWPIFIWINAVLLFCRTSLTQKESKMYYMWVFGTSLSHVTFDMSHSTCHICPNILPVSQGFQKYITWGVSEHLCLKWHVTCDMWHVTCDMLHVTCYMLHLTCYILHVCYMYFTCYLLHVICYMLYVCYMLHVTR